MLAKIRLNKSESFQLLRPQTDIIQEAELFKKPSAVQCFLLSRTHK